MNAKSSGVIVFFKLSIVLMCVAVGIGSYIIFNPDVDNNGIVTLSALSDQSQPDQVNNDVHQESLNSSDKELVPANETAPVIQEQMDTSVSRVTEAAVKLGVLSSISRINQVSSFLTADNKTGVFIFKPQDQADEHVFSTSFELIRSNDSVFYASANFFPNQDAVYDTVEYVEAKAQELETTVFKNLKRVGVIKKNIVVLDGGAVKVFLMPAGSGTVVIKKEVIK